MQTEETSASDATSQPERIRSALLQAIEAGELLPGDAVDEKALADRFGVSRTPVREALLTLAAQHLVRIVPRSGIYVHAPAASELVSMLEALSELEAVVARLCALRMDPGQRDRMQRLTEATRQAAAAGDRHGYETENGHFHDALYEGCGNPVVVEQVRQLRLRLAAFRRRVRDQPGRLLSAAVEHDAVVAAIVDSDAERAAQAMREHIIAKGRAFADLLLAPASAPAGQVRR
ncbi:GntR family transcriptional regulator [Variovorax sp. LT1P1]|uniref:GntR family transcriptional regulator n=1 Tax=Variovorax sp. LT1P1 TaxID=3443730 RepID=UPI003F472409